MDSLLLMKNTILHIAKNDYKCLMSLPNVVGVGYGYKYVNNVSTTEPCIHVLVENKLPNNSINCCCRIPSTYRGIKTDVIQINKQIIGLSDSKFAGGISGKKRPLEGGYGISVINTKNTTGTIGCIVSRGSKYYVLSNNHVLAGYNDFPISSKFVQPAFDDGGKYPNDFIATLSDFIPLYFKSGKAEPENYVDAAIAELTSSSLKSKNIATIGAIKGVANATPNEKIKKVGTTTGATKGQIVSIGVTKIVTYANGKSALFKDQIIAGLYNKGGDSGSIILNEKNQAIGLLMSGGSSNYKTCIFNNIQNVLKSLKISIYN